MWLYVVSIVSIFIISTWPVGEKKKHFQLNFPFYFHYFILFLLFITSEGTSEGSDANSPNIYLLVWFGMLLGMWLELECYWKMVGCWVWVGVLLSVCIGVWLLEYSHRKRALLLEVKLKVLLLEYFH